MFPILSDWTERDFFMEKLHLVPSLDHYYRDWRGGLDYWIDLFFPSIVTDVIHFAIDEMGCLLCKGGTWTVRTFLANKIVTDTINDFVLVLCHIVI